MAEKSEKGQLHPGVQINLLANVDKNELPDVVKKLGKMRVDNWEVLKREYCFYHGIHPNNRKAQYERSERDVLSRLEAFPGGQVTALFEGNPLGLISAIRRNKIFGEYNEEITDRGTYRTHESDGKIFGCCEITVDRYAPKEITKGVAKAMINKEIEICQEMKVPVAVAKTRPYGILNYMQNEGLSSEEIKRILKDRKNTGPFMAYMREYIKPKEDGKTMKNPVLGMHFSNGAEIEDWGIEYGTRCFDRESGGSTIIAAYRGKDTLKQLHL